MSFLMTSHDHTEQSRSSCPANRRLGLSASDHQLCNCVQAHYGKDSSASSRQTLQSSGLRVCLETRYHPPRNTRSMTSCINRYAQYLYRGSFSTAGGTLCRKCRICWKVFTLLADNDDRPRELQARFSSRSIERCPLVSRGRV